MSCTDRISELDDSLLTHILSYLPTKEAVMTQKLSKRWRNVWTYVPVLDFDFADFCSEDIFSYCYGLKVIYVSVHSECHENFVRFIDTVLASRQVQQVDSFSLVWRYQVKSYQNHEHPVRRWILLVLQQRPRVVIIYVRPNSGNLCVSDVAFTCTTLEHMTLHIDNRRLEVLNPASVNLPHLRRLYLRYFAIKADFMNKLLLGCPNLEELELYACTLYLSEISCGNLKSLVIVGCDQVKDIRISIPSLCNLKVTLISSKAEGFLFENMSSLVKACVCFLTDPYKERAFLDSETKILNGLSGVTNLDVILHAAESQHMLEHALKNCPHFVNLKAVRFESFKGCLYGCLDTIHCLVQHSPVLEDLTFYCFRDESMYIELVAQLILIVVDHGKCGLTETRQAHTFGPLEVKELLFQHMKCYEKVCMTILGTESEEEWSDDDVEGGEVWWEEELGGETDWEEEDEGEDVE